MDFHENQQLSYDKTKWRNCVKITVGIFHRRLEYSSMKLILTNRHPSRRISRLFLEKKVKKVLRLLKLKEGELGITFVTDRFISRLNSKYLRKKKATDVLSFPVTSKPLMGDIVISLDTASRQARQNGLSTRARVFFLVIHGLLHLLGYDHVKEADWKKMRRMEEKLYRA